MVRIPPLAPHDYPLSGSCFAGQTSYTKVPMGGSSASLWSMPIVPAVQLNAYEDTGIEDRMQRATQDRIAKETLYKTIPTTTPFGKIGACAMPPFQPKRSIQTPSYALADTHPAFPVVDEVYRRALFNNFMDTPIITNREIEGDLYVNSVTA